jgi:dienelactone hydrolase
MASILPDESKTAHVELMLPGHLAPDARPPVCLILAATAEEGFVRRRFFAGPLVRRGVAALLLENPFYGKRRPRGQLGPSLRTVADQFAMNTSTVEEARALLAWLRRRGHRDVGATGYSQGGMMAAFAGALSPFAMAVVPRGAGASARPIFTESALAQTFDWKKLAAEMRGLEEARRYFERCLEPVVVTRYPPPRAPELAVILGARSDGFIPAEDVQALHDHWRGSELRWLDAGHVTAVVFHRSPHHRAVLDAFDRLAAHPRRED